MDFSTEYQDISIWGKPTAVLDSSEPNFAHSHYVGEPFAAMSAAIWVIFSIQLFFQYSSSKVAQSSLLWLYFLHLMCGLSGVVYHTTLKYLPQLIDRYFVVCWMIAVANIVSPFFRYRPFKSRAMLLAMLGAGSLVFCLIDLNVVPFALLLVFILYTLHRHRKEGTWDPTSSVKLRSATTTATGWCILALVSFLLDGYATHFNYYHVIWHLLAYIGTLKFMHCLQVHLEYTSTYRKHDGHNA